MPSVREAPPTASATPSLLSEQPALPVGSPGLRRVRICERQTAQVKLHLEEAYKKDLTEHKDLIKELITSIVTRMEADPRE